MKKATMFVLAAALTVSLAGCGSKEKETEAPKTEAVTEAKTEAATEAKTEAATEAVTEATTEAATEVVTEAETEAVTEAATEAETEAATEAETEAAETEAVEAESETTEEETLAAAATEEVTEAATEAAETEEVTEAAETEAVTEAATEAEETEEVTEAATEAAETEEVTEAATEAAETEEVTEAATEAAETEAATEAAETEEVTEAATEAAETEAVTEAATEAAETEEVTEAATEAAETEEVTEAAETEPVEVVTEAELTVPEGTSYKAAFLIPGTLGDKSFWDSGNEGLTKLRDELGEDVFDFKVEQMGGEAADMANYEPTFLDYCDSGEYDLIITGSWQCMDALLAAVEEYPEQKFLLFDEEFDFEGNGNPENVYNVLFKQNEVSYLVGAAAAQMSESGIISFLGGMDGKVINDFLVGYIQGAKDTNPDIQVAVSMVGDYEDSAKGKDLSLAMYNAGADIGFNVAGNAGLGLIEAAAETDKLAFGVDSDQAALLADQGYDKNIPTSALKNVGDALYRSIVLDMNGELAYGTKESLGFAENGVGLVKDAHYEEMVPEEVRASMDELEKKISDGEITVYTSAGMTTEEIEDLKASVAVK